MVCFVLSIMYTNSMKLIDGDGANKLYRNHTETDGTRETFLGDLSIYFADKLDQAKQVDVLSARNGKLLTVEEEPDGTKFVKRAYSRDGIGEVLMTNLGYYDFSTAWHEMKRILDAAEMPMVRSSLVHCDEEGALVLSDYIEDGRPVREASTEAKIEFARRLVRCFYGKSGQARLALPVLNWNGFITTADDDGKDEIVLIDVDPCVQRPQHDHRRAYISMKRIGRLFWDEWCTEEDRQEVLSAVVSEIGETLSSTELEMDKNLWVFLNLNLMSHGADPNLF